MAKRHITRDEAISLITAMQDAKWRHYGIPMPSAEEIERRVDKVLKELGLDSSQTKKEAD